MKIKWNQIIHALVLVKIGQDLGTYSKTSVAVHDVIELIASFVSAFVHI
jgi:hypothetical protein